MCVCSGVTGLRWKRCVGRRRVRGSQCSAIANQSVRHGSQTRLGQSRNRSPWPGNPRFRRLFSYAVKTANPITGALRRTTFCRRLRHTDRAPSTFKNSFVSRPLNVMGLSYTPTLIIHPDRDYIRSTVKSQEKYVILYFYFHDFHLP